MGRRIVERDWSDTPLGPIASWPQSLATAVDIMLNSRHPMFIAWGPALSFLYNDAYIPVLGAKHPDVLGYAFEEVWAEIWDDLLPLAEQATSGNATWSDDLRLFMQRNGYVEEVYFTFSYSPLRDESGAIGGMLCACIETTAKVLNERRTRALKDLADRGGAAAGLDEALGNCARVLSEHRDDVPFALFYRLRSREDARLVAVAGLGEDEARQRWSDPKTWPLADLDKLRKPLFLEDIPRRGGAIVCAPHPEPVRAAVVLPVVPPGAERPLAAVIVGISPRLPVDSAYRGFLDFLQAGISTVVAKALAYDEERRRADSLAQIDRAKTVFFSNISHEFRTPLTLMLGPLEELLSRETVAEADRAEIDVAHRNGLRLLRLVNSLLDFSRVEAGRIQATYEPTDLSTLTTELVSSFRSACDRAGLRLVVDAPPLPSPVVIDRDMWEKIVLNLLSNAFKFTLDGEIVVEVGAEDDHAVLSVRDTGIGIPEEELSHVFDRFYRIENGGGRTHEGSGIGLSLVEELVKLHGGKVGVSSVPGEGTTFDVRIPFGTEHLPKDRIAAERSDRSRPSHADGFVQEALRWLPNAGSAPAALDDWKPLPTPGSERPRLLYADDNADMRDYVSRLLSDHFEVELATDGEAALAAARRSRPDLLLTDVMMPKLDGFGLLAALRDDDRLRDLPIILLSARAGEEARMEGLEAGADDYLVKPLSARELLIRLHNHLDLARMRDEAASAVRESEARFRNMADNAPVIIWVNEPDGSCTYLSKAWYDFTGQDPETALGFGWLDAVHPDDRLWAGEPLRTKKANHEPYQFEFRIRRKDGVWRWAIDAASPRFASDGQFLGYVGCAIDITEQKEREERIHTLLREVNHRSKNMLSLVQSVAHQTASNGAGDFLTKFAERIHALSAGQDLLVNSEWKGVDLADLVESQLAHFRDLIGSRITLRGEPLTVEPAAAQTLGMALHELATNAGKYGALSDETGRIDIAWDAERREPTGAAFSMSWQETGGPRVRRPSRLGFGHRVVKDIVEGSLDGEVVLDFPPSGMCWRLRCPIDKVTGANGTAPAAGDVPDAEAHRSPQARRVLVVEDDVIVALDLVAVLEDSGFEVIGPARSVREAQKLLREFGCFSAILDINLGRETSEPIAHALRRDGVPFVALSGYARSQQPDVFAEAPFIAKPFRTERVIEEIRRFAGTA